MPKTRLTKDVREEIIDRVIKATNIPELKADIMRRAKAAAVDAVRAAQPDGFYEAVINVPKQWIASQNDLYLGANFAALVKILNGHSLHVFYRIRFDDPVSVAMSAQKEMDLSAISALNTEAEALAEHEAQLRREISSFLVSCRHIEDAVERMPELEPHIPKIVKPMPLVAPSNLLSTLSQLGFDKTVRA